MKPLFTVHAGEFLAGDFIQRHFKNVNVWIPTKDVGVDLLVSDAKNKHTVSLQVKFSRDFSVTHERKEFRGSFRASGWWSLNKEKIEKSKADYWLFVLVGFAHKTEDYIIIKPEELLAKLETLRGNTTIFQTYLCVTAHKNCWETRGLGRKELASIINDEYRDDVRDFSQHLDNWGPIRALNE